MNTVLTLVIVNYNQGIFFEDCIRSVKEQHLEGLQLIIIDDCSTDNSVEQMEGLLQHYNIKAHFIKNRINRGICANLNLALSVAEGKYFSFIASDDWAEENCYINMIRAFDSTDGNVAVVYGDCKIVDPQRNLLHQSYLKYYRNDLKVPPQGNIFKDLLRGNFIPAMVTMTRTRVLKSLGGFDEKLKVEDYDMWLRISREYSFSYVKDASAYYRILQHSLIRRIGARKYEDWIDMYLKHTDVDSESFAIIRQQLLKCCEFLFYTDSEKFLHYYHTIEKFGVDKKLKVLKLIKSMGVSGSRFKRWSDKVQGRQTKQI